MFHQFYFPLLMLIIGCCDYFELFQGNRGIILCSSPDAWHYFVWSVRLFMGTIVPHNRIRHILQICFAQMFADLFPLGQTRLQWVPWIMNLHFLLLKLNKNYPKISKNQEQRINLIYTPKRQIFNVIHQCSFYTKIKDRLSL